MITWWKLTALAIVQGIAEFLPISSSGHLVVLEYWMDLSSDLTDINIVLHAGTLLAILVVYRVRIGRMLLSDRRLLGLVVVGTIPAVVFGLGLKLFLEWLLEDPLTAGVCLPLTGAILFWCHRHPPGDLRCENLSWKGALGIGFAQAFAILPGISRSGTTIAAGLAFGLSRQEAAAFSFLLAIPAIAGATLLETLSLAGGEPISTSPMMLISGAFLAAVVGWLSLHWLLRVLQRGRLNWFGGWCVALGMVVLIQQFGG
jgi:undecaprenyl-diphosphatase